MCVSVCVCDTRRGALWPDFDYDLKCVGTSTSTYFIHVVHTKQTTHRDKTAIPFHMWRTRILVRMHCVKRWWFYRACGYAALFDVAAGSDASVFAIAVAVALVAHTPCKVEKSLDKRLPTKQIAPSLSALACHNGPMLSFQHSNLFCWT